MQELIYVIQWWTVLFVIGISFFPLTFFLFKNFYDKGYLFSKVLGTAVLSYSVFILGIFKIVPFSNLVLFALITIFLAINIFLFIFLKQKIKKNLVKIIIFEELIFFTSLLFWTSIKSYQSEIYGLEKYMDFGFINSILRSDYFPPKDMWYYPYSINYYYFGHLITAVLTKISNIKASISYNLMLSSLFAFTFSLSFSLILNLFKNNAEKLKKIMVFGGIAAALFVSLSGNLHTIYSFFLAYPNENPKPFWDLVFSISNYPNSYWYPNATRFIPFTIHEFPIYSFVVSDLHGHVLDIPLVLFSIGLIYSIFQDGFVKLRKILVLSFFAAIMYMTNVWDGIIYPLLAILVILTLNIKLNKSQQEKNQKINYLKFDIYKLILTVLILILGFFIFSFPFNLNFKPFVSGIGIICAPPFLTNIGKLGPFLFEKDHCQRSEWWQLTTLYGFFYFWVIFFSVFLFKKVNPKREIRSAKQTQNYKIKKVFGNLKFGFDKLFGIWNMKFEILPSDVFILFLIFLSTLLIIIPEFIYVKDIYPAHYRANTMFKLVYQAFIMLSLSSAYIIIRLISNFQFQSARWRTNFKKIYVLKLAVLVFIGSIGLFLVFSYTYFAINSYFNEFKTKQGIDGISYLKRIHPYDYDAILWINENVKGQPVMLEAQGDSYTDYERISANTGLPTIFGWTVHEWLWRGTYDIVAPRIEEVKNIYESPNVGLVKTLLQKYDVAYVYVGGLERQKYPALNEQKFSQLGEVIYQNGDVKIYKINS